MAATVRIDPAAYESLVAIAAAQHVSLTEALSRAIETHRRKVFLSGVVEDFEKIGDETSSGHESRERVMWETSVSDGLETEPPHPDARRRPATRRPSRRKPSRSKARR